MLQYIKILLKANRMKNVTKISKILLILLTLTSITMANDTARQLDSKATGAISIFHSKIPSSKTFLDKAKGYVIFPDINEAGFFFGGKYGEGVLRVRGVTKSYHSITSGSVGLQMGMQKYALVIVFTTDAALAKFMADDDWETDMDFNIAMADWNAEEELDEIDFGSDMVGFIFDSVGMMGNFTFEGTKFEKIYPKK
jgi:lipid-binding SYLF domain-containing protein